MSYKTNPMCIPSKIYLFRVFFLFLGISSTYLACSQSEKQDDLFFKERLETVDQANIFKSPDYYNWGPSILKDTDGSYHLFYSRWKKSYGFTGWLTHSEIAHAVAPSPAGPWTYRATVLQGAGKGRWDAVTAHNPKIKYFEGK
jgi:hypothetical protein